VDFKLENVLVSLHSLKTMGLGAFGVSAPLFVDLKSTKRTVTLHSLKIMESFDNGFTSQVDFNVFVWRGTSKL
jgi:hypothetical protein